MENRAELALVAKSRRPVDAQSMQPASAVVGPIGEVEHANACATSRASPHIII